MSLSRTLPAALRRAVPAPGGAADEAVRIPSTCRAPALAKSFGGEATRWSGDIGDNRVRACE